MAGADELILPMNGSFRGICGGDARVLAGARVTVMGIIDGDLTVEAGSVVEMSGIVGGRIINEGGRVDVSGLVG